MKDKNIDSSTRAENIRLFSSFDRELRLPKYQPNRFAEQFTECINEKLSGLDELIVKKSSVDYRPSIIITGVPRSGTTVISQLLPARYNLGYVSNLMARFYKVPLTGAWLQQQLIPHEIHFLREFWSHHGVTQRIFEPHEFGYFWSQYLNFGFNCHQPKNDKEIEQLNFIGLDKVLAQLSTVFGRPAAYKCSIAPFLIRSFVLHMNVFLVHIIRDREKTVQSILNIREERLGDQTKWWSIRPCGWQKLLDKPPIEQVEWQYDRVVDAIRKGSIGFENKIYELTLEDLVNSPEMVLEDLMSAYARYSGITVSKVGEPIMPLTKNYTK